MDDLIAQFRAGDEAAIRAVHQRYAGAVRTVARSMTSDQELIAEVVQQTFIKAWRAIDSFDASREFAPWIYSIARRTTIDVLRRERRPTAGDHEPETDVAISSISLERTWEIYEVRQAIEALPPDEREVVRLSQLMGLTHPEIAERLGIPIGTVKSRSGRAHKRLHAALAHLQPSANQRGASSVQGDEES